MNNQQPVNIPLNVSMAVSGDGQTFQMTLSILGMQNSAIMPIQAIPGLIEQLKATQNKAAGMIVNPHDKGFKVVK